MHMIYAKRNILAVAIVKTAFCLGVVLTFVTAFFIGIICRALDLLKYQMMRC